MRAAALAIAALILAFNAAAQDAAPSAQDLAWQETMAASQEGPLSIPLRDQATLQLPCGYAYVPQAPAARLLTAWGNTVGEPFIGLILPMSGEN
jgi:uncharacterized membrane-anchored protein